MSRTHQICWFSPEMVVRSDLLRVIRKGPAIKDIVDDAIDQCSAVFNLRDSIEESRNRAEQATDEKQKRMHAQKGWSSGIHVYPDFRNMNAQDSIISAGISS